MKSLNRIQIIAKVLRVLCVIGFVISIIGAVGCVLGLSLFNVVKDLPITKDRATVMQVLEKRNIPEYMVYTYLAVALADCGVSIFICKYNELLFKTEIMEGTPFTMSFVKNMRKNALVNILVSIGFIVLVGIVIGIVKVLMGYDGSESINLVNTFAYGIAMLILSLFVEYGAEVSEQKSNDNETIN